MFYTLVYFENRQNVILLLDKIGDYLTWCTLPLMVKISRLI